MKRQLRSSVVIFVLLNYIGTLLPMSTSGALAQELVTLPSPAELVHLSPSFDPPVLGGLVIHPDDPFRLDFILDRGDSSHGPKEETTRLIKYFLASLTVPENDLWVNFSPYEKDRIIPHEFGRTEMGRDLLAADYVLKQISASLISPQDETGRKFWKRVYEEAAKRYGTTDIPVDTFNRVWIMPEKAQIYENAQKGTVYVTQASLKVMLEEDCLALAKESAGSESSSLKAHSLGSEILREIVLPELTREVNSGRNFTRLRQIYHSLILASWYKKKIHDGILSRIYANKNKIAGIRYTNSIVPSASGVVFRDDVEGLYETYLKSVKKGVYNYIEESSDPASNEIVPRRYFSGGARFSMLPVQDVGDAAADSSIEQRSGHSFRRIGIRILPADGRDAASTEPGKPQKIFHDPARATEEIIQELGKRVDHNKGSAAGYMPLVVAVIGEAGAGKSFFSQYLERHINQMFPNERGDREVIVLGLDDFKIPRDERGDIVTYSDYYEHEMIRELEKNLAEGKPVYKYIFNLKNGSRFRRNQDDVDHLGVVTIFEDNRALKFDASLTAELRKTGRISPVSEIYIDVTTTKNEYDVIEKIPTRGNIFVLEGTMAGVNKEAIKQYAACINIEADPVTLDENHMMRLLRKERYSGKDDSLSRMMAREKEARRQYDEQAQENKRIATIRLVQTRPLFPFGTIIRIAQRKLLNLQKNYAKLAVPEQKIYMIIQKHLTDIIHQLQSLDRVHASVDSDENPMPITILRDGEVEHRDFVFSNRLLHQILETEESLTELEKEVLRNSIDFYLNGEMHEVFPVTEGEGSEQAIGKIYSSFKIGERSAIETFASGIQQLIERTLGRDLNPSEYVVATAGC